MSIYETKKHTHKMENNLKLFLFKASHVIKIFFKSLVVFFL